MLAKLA
jgi:hypothetical protein